MAPRPDPTPPRRLYLAMCWWMSACALVPEVARVVDSECPLLSLTVPLSLRRYATLDYLGGLDRESSEFQALLALWIVGEPHDRVSRCEVVTGGEGDGRRDVWHIEVQRGQELLVLDYDLEGLRREILQEWMRIPDVEGSRSPPFMRGAAYLKVCLRCLREEDFDNARRSSEAAARLLAGRRYVSLRWAGPDQLEVTLSADVPPFRVPLWFPGLRLAQEDLPR